MEHRLKLPDFQLIRDVSKKSFEAVRWSAEETYCADRTRTAILVICFALKSLTPAAIAFIFLKFFPSTDVQIEDLRNIVEQAMPAILAVFLLAIGSQLNSVLYEYVRGSLALRVDMRVSNRFLVQAGRLDLAQFESCDFQDVVDRARKSTTTVFGLAEATLTLISSAIQAGTLCIIMVFIEPVLTTVLFAVGLLISAMRAPVVRLHHEIYVSTTESRRWINYFVRLFTNVSNIPELKSMQLDTVLIQNFRRRLREQQGALEGAYRYDAIYGVVTTLLFWTVLCAIMIVMGISALDGTLTLASVLAFWYAGYRLGYAIKSFGDALGGIWQSGLNIHQAMEFLRLNPLIEAPEAQDPVEGQDPQVASKVAIELLDISFAYPGQADPVIKNLSFAINAGETVALVGHNGAGKSTFVKLLARLYDVDQGSIRIDGVDIRKVPTDTLRSKMAIAWQNPVRYEATLGENIAYGNWNDLHGNAKSLAKIVTKFSLIPLMRKLPDGLNTRLGRKFGTHELSGGEWQGLVVARTLASPAPIVILDEPTANLDVNAEYELLETIQGALSGRTVVIVSHRLSTVRRASRILLMEDGRVAEQGTHDELLSLNGRYARFYNMNVGMDADETPSIGA